MTCTSVDYERRPGKFETSGEIGEKLYELTMLGLDEELGDVQDFGWYGLLLDTGLACASHAIVTEDNVGFFDYEGYDTKEEALKVWAKLEVQYETFCDAQGEDA